MFNVRRACIAIVSALSVAMLAPSVAQAETASLSSTSSEAGLPMPGGPYKTHFSCQYANNDNLVTIVSGAGDDCVRFGGPNYFYVPILGRFLDS